MTALVALEEEEGRLQLAGCVALHAMPSTMSRSSRKPSPDAEQMLWHQALRHASLQDQEPDQLLVFINRLVTGALLQQQETLSQCSLHS